MISVKIKEALENVINFAKSYSNFIFVGHNCKIFDIRVLYNALEKTDMMEEFLWSGVHGFVDTLPLFKEIVPNQVSYSESNLHEQVFGEQYTANDFLEDVVSLHRLFQRADTSLDTLIKYLFSVQSSISMFRFKHTAQCLLQTLYPLIEQEVLTKCMATKIANSGLGFQDLKLAKKRDGKQGIHILLSEIYHTLNISNYFKSLSDKVEEDHLFYFSISKRIRRIRVM